MTTLTKSFHSPLSLPLIDVWTAPLLNKARIPTWVVSLASILAGSLLIALSAQLSVRLPFSLVPVTAQTLAVLCVGAVLGSRKGALSVMAYLLEGAVGFPVLSGGGFGLLHLMGPTGGYLVGFIFAAGFAGLITQRKNQFQWIYAIPAFLAAHTLIFVFGIAWLSQFIGFEQAFLTGYVPFLPGEILKVFMAVGIIKKAKNLS